MQGKIMAYSAAVSAGIIKGEDGNPYTFSAKNWLSSDREPENNLTVVFTPAGAIADKISGSQKQIA